jgi:hypothetical protein
MKILNDNSKFKRLEYDPTLEREKHLQGHLKYLVDKKYFDNSTRLKITPCGSKAGVMYCLPKVHKQNTPLRPIISAIDTYNYKLAKYLDKILKPLVNDNEYILKDTFDFVNKIKELNVAADQYMISFDVESLFTNIPTDETIEIILNQIYENATSLYHGLLRKDMKKLLEICTKKSHFQFNGQFYEQTDGVAMGSPLGPLFANIFMQNFERQHNEHLKTLGLNKWSRYVDDVFATVDQKETADVILEYLNKQHKNIKFTVEHEQKGCLAFLDTNVKRQANRYITSVFHKKTFTGVYLNWTSLTSRKYKTGLIKCLLDRAWKICTLDTDRTKEIAAIKANLIQNEYPIDIIEKEINKFIELKNKPATTVEKEDKPHKRFLVLPFVNRRADEFASKLKTLVNKSYNQIDFTIAFKTPGSIGELFPFKDKTTKAVEKSKVVYKLKCDTCGAEYIGKTERILSIRIAEHKTKKESVCNQHETNNPGHKIEYDNVEVIDSADNDMKLRIKELLNIMKRNPTLNKQLGTQSEYEINTILIKAYPQFKK